MISTPDLVRRVGISGLPLHAASLGSIGLCIGLWIRAKTVSQEERANAERRALFVGLWPPMFWLIGDTVDRARPGAGERDADHHRPQRPARRGRRPRLPRTSTTTSATPRRTSRRAGTATGSRSSSGTRRRASPRRAASPRPRATLVNSYEFSDPRILRAAYKYPGDLVGRNMLLEGRFLFLRFLLGVRIVAAHDELVDGPNGPERLIGWSYATLDGHLEQGKLRYEIAKEIDTGRVEFRIIAYSRWSPIANRLVWAGFNLFGRRTQLTWYHHAMTRLQRLLDDPPDTPEPDADGIVRAPVGGGPGPVRGVRRPVRAPRPRHAPSRLASAFGDPAPLHPGRAL